MAGRATSRCGLKRETASKMALGQKTGPRSGARKAITEASGTKTQPPASQSPIRNGVLGGAQLYTLNGKRLEALRPGFHSTIDYTQAIIGNIEESRADGKPFFAYLAFQAPHDPFQLPDDWLDSTRAAMIRATRRRGLRASRG